MAKHTLNSRPLAEKGWNTFAHHMARNGKFWLWAVLLLGLSRLILIWHNRYSFDDQTPLSAYAQTFLTGFRFDMPVATLFTIPSIFCASLGLVIPMRQITNALRVCTTYLFTILWVIITTVTLGYFKEYHNQFDVHLLGVVHDDFSAIVQTIWKSYPVGIGSVVMILICTVLIFLGRRWIQAPFPIPTLQAPQRLVSRIAVTLLLLVTLTLGLRGSLGRRPMQLKDASRTEDTMLNRCVINPFSALNYAIKAHQSLMTSNGLDTYLKNESILAAFQEYADNTSIKTVDEAFLHTAKGRSGKKPKHIFLVVMESYNGWTMLDQHAQWNVSNNLKQLGQNGIYVRHFLPGSRSTMTSLATLISGMADAGITTNERSRPGAPAYSTAIAPQMKQLGYQTHIYYAGYGGWARVEDFSQEQGFEFTHMGSSMDGGADTNEWGVSDKRLFSYIKSNFDPDTPSFNIILTSSNHPPYSLDLKKEQCPVTSVPPEYQDKFQHGTSTLTMLGHHWYSDQWLGDWVRHISGQSPDCLFAITGDHWGRTYPGPRPTAFERAIVPLVLYGPDILPKNIDGEKLRGSHYDLGATLIELAANPGFEYHAIGRNILKTQPNDVAQSRLWLMGDDYIHPGNKHGPTETLDGQRLDTYPRPLKPALRRYKLTHGITWWRLRNGNQLPEN